MKIVDIKTVSQETGLTVLAIRKLVRAGEIPHMMLGNPAAKKGKYVFNLDLVNQTLEKKMNENYKA